MTPADVDRRRFSGSGTMIYAIFGGADFGAGLWDLLAGTSRRGAAQRELIDRAVGPVWEANHTWLIFDLVILWSAFPGAFAAITSTLYLPLALAAVGIVLRGSGFAFRKVSHRLTGRRAFGLTFALSSVVTPFFLGTVLGGDRVGPGAARRAAAIRSAAGSTRPRSSSASWRSRPVPTSPRRS